MPKQEKKLNIANVPLVFPIDFGALKASELPTQIHILPVGKWNHPVYGKMEITADDIDEFIQHFNDGLRNDVPITEGHEVDDEKPAVGWFRKLINKGSEGLWAVVEWTDRGKQLLAEKAYKYFSPEFYQKYEDPETRKEYDNVLVGGALTNKPYFKELSPVVLSEHLIKSFKENDMPTLEEVLKKESGKLTDEEKAVLVEHKDELTDEQKETFKADLAVEKTEEKPEEKPEPKPEEKPVEKPEEKKDASEKVSINASELASLKEQAKQGAAAHATLEERDIKDAVSTMTFSESNKAGHFLPKSKDKVVGFMKTLSIDQRKAFAEIVKELPDVKMFKEIGKDGGETKSAKDEVNALVEKAMSDNKALTYGAATKKVMSENVELAKRYEAETQPAQA